MSDRPGTVRCVVNDALPDDPFADNAEIMAEFGELDQEKVGPLGHDERAELTNDLSELAVYQALLEPTGVKGVVVHCMECDVHHYHDWQLLRSSLQRLLDDGMVSQHEPAFNPNPEHYVTWEYCKGYTDGVRATESTR